MKLFVMTILTCCLFEGIAAAQVPTVTGVQNAASNIPAGLPNAGIAQGSIIAIYGKNMGPATLTIASGIPWQTALAGTSATITVGAQVVNLLIYYTSAGQIAGLLPSSTPVGAGTLKVTYTPNGTSVGTPVTVLQNGVGIFTWSQNGSGEGILTFPDYSVVSASKAANAGDVLSIWATGIGPVTGNEAAGALPGDMTSIPVKVWVGGTSATVQYRGRSGCCVGEDQIAFTVPSGVTGCNVPLVIQINNYVSNSTTMPIAATGSRVCTPNSSSISTDTLQKLLGKSQVSIGGVVLSRSSVQSAAIGPLPSTTTKSDDGTATFAKVTVSGDQAVSLVDTTAIGACKVVIFTSQATTLYPGMTYTTLDAGSAITVAGPNGTKSLPKATSSGVIYYNATLGNGTAGNYLDAGTYTISGPGGADVGSFSATLKIPTPLTWTNQSTTTSVTRSSGVTLNWTGGDPGSTVEITGSSYVSTDTTGSNIVGATFSCHAPVSAGTFTVPPPVLLSLPASGTISGFTIPGTLSLYNTTTPVTITPTGLDYGYVTNSVYSTISVPYN